MPTPDMSDDELDALFRRGAEAYPEEPPPLGAWARMDDKLNTATVTTLVRRKLMRLFGAGVVVLLLTFLGWQGYREFVSRPVDNSAKSASSDTNNNQSTPESSAVNSASQSFPDAVGTEASSDLLAVRSPSAAAKASATIEKKENLLPKATTRDKSGSQPVAAWLRPPRSRRPQNVPRRELGAVGSTGGHFAGISSSGQSENGPLPMPNSEGNLSNSSSEQRLTSQVIPDSVVSQAIVAASDSIQSAPADSVKKPAPGATLPLYRWSLGLIGGPSASGVRATEGARLGGEIGLTLDYRVTPRLRVRSGLVRSVKRYAARGSDYYPPYGYWQSGSPILALDANCRITEIPLDVRYDIVVRPTYSLFLSTGLTTLLMRNERYAYQYERNGAITTATWSLAHGSNHALGVLNLSGGVERAVSTRWSVQAEPFLKLPLSGVGFGHIRLRSAGVAFSVKYGLLGRVSP
ncbi:hypothetical protein [Hymenobacter sp. HDW8]|uniref:hypothetical protein n=1 Tax=Hymenobacter sp. HDW8 TaxID=2714932 RepID=UPI00140A2370|nr:hypothetical protein [Hymenobacter sp. HDW8]QIL75858.1 hypothetical protein G7064_08315 [Hymenobacter sp. HDW8]